MFLGSWYVWMSGLNVAKMQATDLFIRLHTWKPSLLGNASTWMHLRGDEQRSWSCVDDRNMGEFGEVEIRGQVN